MGAYLDLRPRVTSTAAFKNLVPDLFRGATSSSVGDPLSILGSAIKQWVRADQGITTATGVTNWADLSGNGNDFQQATGINQPAFEAAGFNGRPSVLFDGTNDVMTCSSSLAATLPGGTDTPFSLYIEGQFVTTSSATPVMWSGGRSSAANPTIDLFYNNTGTVWTVNKRDDAGTLVSVTGGTRDTNRHLFEIHHTGIAVTLVVDGVDIFTDSAQNVGAMTLDRLGLGALVINTVTLFCNCRIAELVMANAVSTAPQRADMRTYFSRYG